MLEGWGTLSMKWNEEMLIKLYKMEFIQYSDAVEEMRRLGVS